jgi:type VI secretion system protein ImpB
MGLLRGARPRVAFPVPNGLSSEKGDLMIDLEFESVDDFTPEGVARKVDALRLLLEEL